MRCPKCGSENCQIITETQTSGKDYSIGKGLCGWCLTGGPIGLLCGFCTGGKKTLSQAYWICNTCGKKWRA